MLPTDLTVSAIVEKNGRFLIIEECTSGGIVINQPGGHIEAGESPEQATEREALEESACLVTVTELLGVYLWVHPQTKQNFLRIAYVANLVKAKSGQALDDGIVSVNWLSIDEIRARQKDLRTPMVLRSVEDYVGGRRECGNLLAELMPVQKNVKQMLASASVV